MSLKCIAVSGYRSLHDVCFSTGPLTVITGGNGVGKSNVYRALELLHAAAHGRLAISLAREGGLSSVAWAGPERVRTAEARRQGKVVQGTVRTKPIRVQMGIQLEVGSFEMSVGLPVRIPSMPSAFDGDAEVKEEWLWAGPPRRRNAPFFTRAAAGARGQDSDGRWRNYAPLNASESVLSQLDEPHLLPELHSIRATIRAFRFYHAFRTDPDSPLRQPQIGVRTAAMASDGRDVGAALQTIHESGDGDALADAVQRGLGATLDLGIEGNQFEVGLRVNGLLRRLGPRELSDGTLKYLALLAALYAPLAAPLLVFNEPESSLHPDLLPALAENLALSARRSSVWVITHAKPLVAEIERRAPVTRIELERDEDGATVVRGQRPIDRPPWP